MVINPGGSIINLKDRLQEADRKKTQSDSGVSTKSADDSSSASDSTTGSTSITDIIGIRNENRLAIATSGSILSSDDAQSTLDELKRQFADDTDTALNAHKQTDANTVMQFYPFE